MALPAFFDPIVNAPRWQKFALGIFGLVILAAGSYFLVLSPLEITVNALRAQRSTVQRELLEARAAAADLARVRLEIAALQARLDTMKERLPGEKDLPPLFRTVTDAAYQAGLQVSLFQPKEGRIHDYYVEIPITLAAEGGYHQLGDFFERVAGFPRVVTVQEMKMAGISKSRNPLRADLVLATYQYRPVGSPPAPKPGQPGAQPPGAQK
jgi:type IV pilus assembly protein PilO